MHACIRSSPWGESRTDLDTQLMQLNTAMDSRSITKIPYKENNSLLVMVYFMSRSALASRCARTPSPWDESVFEKRP